MQFAIVAIACRLNSVETLETVRAFELDKERTDSLIRKFVRKFAEIRIQSFEDD